VTKTTLPGQVVVILKRFILTEDLREGDKLPTERDLAATFGVSQRVVREALDILVGEGVIYKKYGRGTFIRSLEARSAGEGTPAPSEAVDELYRVRRAIEVGAVCLAANHATQEDLDALQDVIDTMGPKAERGESVAADEMYFHLALLRAAHNEAFQQMDYLLAESIRFKMYDRPSRLFSTDGTGNPFVSEHQAIVDALRTGDSAEAMRVLHKHLTRNIEAAIKSPGALVAEAPSTRPGD
jgi:GntR family transcriptional repressor for pyruvate dehydrogenase complex